MSWIVRVALLLCLVVPIYSYSLYGVAAEWGPNMTFMYYSTVKIDRTTGQITNLTTDASYIGFMGSSRGVSAFDEEEGRMLAVTFPGQGPVRASDVVHKKILPSLVIDTDLVFGLTYDNAHRKMYVLYQKDSYLFLLQVGALTARWVVNRFAATTANWAPYGAMDTKSGTYFLITGEGSLVKNPDYKIYSVDVATGNIVRTVQIDNRACPGAFMFVEYDNTTDTLLGGGGSNTEYITWFFFRVDPKTGRCTKRDLPIQEQVMNWAYDSRTQELLYIQEDSSGQKLGTYNIRTGRLGTLVQLRDIIYIAALEVSMFH